MDTQDLKWSIDLAFEYASEINKYVDENTPWKLDTEIDSDREKLESVLFYMIANLRKIAIMLLPFFDTKMRELLSRIGVPYDDAISLVENLSLDPVSFFIAEKGEPLYMRIGK